MHYCVEVATKAGFQDKRAESLKGQIELLGIPGVEMVDIVDRYYLSGTIATADLERLSTELLHDPIVETASAFPMETDGIPEASKLATIDVVLHPGVTDSAAESLMAGIAEIGVEGVEQAATGRRYMVHGTITDDDLATIASSLLANDVVQNYYINEAAPPPFALGTEKAADVEYVPLAGLGDGQLEALSVARRLSLDIFEMRAIQAYFGERAPTDLWERIQAEAKSRRPYPRARLGPRLAAMLCGSISFFGAAWTLDTTLRSTPRPVFSAELSNFIERVAPPLRGQIPVEASATDSAWAPEGQLLEQLLEQRKQR